MHADQRPANANTPPWTVTPWAAWPGLAPHMAVWSAVAAAGLENWVTLQRAWLDAGRDAMRRQQEAFLAAPRDTDGPGAVVLTATVEDMRECGAALLQSQIDALEAWRRSA